MSDYQIPFDPQTGDMLDYEGWGEVDWREPTAFTATLQLLGFERGRSSATFIWQDVASGVRYPMFLKDTRDLIKRSTIERGRIRATWGYAKRGTNYGIRLIDAEVS